MEEELLKGQKLESLGVLAGGIAHDFNNILTGIVLKTQLARRNWARGDDPSQHFSSIEEATQLATTLTHQLLTFAKGGAPITKSASISQLLEESTRFVLRGSKIKCNCLIEDDLWTAEIDPGQINQVINNLVINAEQAMPQGGTITLLAGNVHMTSQNRVGELASGTLCQDLRRRRRHWNPCRQPPSHLRPLLHHQRRGPRTWACRHLFHYSTSRRIHLGGKRSRRRDGVHVLRARV